MYELEGEREFCHFSSLSVEITSCSFFFIRRISLCLVGKSCHRSLIRLIDTHRNPCARESRFVSIKVKRPDALIGCKGILIRNVSRDQYFVQSWLMLDLRKGFSSCFFLFLLIIVSSLTKIVWKVDKRFFSIEKYERSGKKLKVRIYWFQGGTKSFNLEKIG